MIDKEYLEVYCNGSIAIVNDFKKLTILGDKTINDSINQDKGPVNYQVKINKTFYLFVYNFKTLCHSSLIMKLKLI